MEHIKSLLLFSIVIAATFVTIKATPEKEQAVGRNDDLYAEDFAQFVPSDTSSVSGFFGFQGKANGVCRLSGSFDAGLSSAYPSDYGFKVETKEGTASNDLSKAFQNNIMIHTPASEYFKVDFTKEQLDCSKVVGKALVLYLNGKVIGSAVIQEVE